MITFSIHTRRSSLGHCQLQRLLRTPQLFTLANDYHAVSASLNEGRPLRQQAPGSRVLADIGRLAHLLINPGAAAEVPARRTGRFRRVVRTLFGL